MKKTLLLMLLAVATLTVSAQKRNRGVEPTKRAQEVVDRLKAPLELTKKQAKEFYDIHVKHYKNHREVFKKYGRTDKLITEKNKEGQRFHKELKALLGNEKNAKYMKLQKAWIHEQRKGLPDNGRGRGGKGNGQGRRGGRGLSH